MIDAERFRVDLDLGDDKPALKLWFNNRALIAISKRLQFDLPLHRAYDVLAEHLLATTLSTYVWAGRLWDNRNITIEEVAARVDDAPLPTNKLVDVVADAMFRAIYGETPADALARLKAAGVPANGKDPHPPAAGPGTSPSSSPSASADFP
jgi:hypothetical protein